MSINVKSLLIRGVGMGMVGLGVSLIITGVTVLLGGLTISTLGAVGVLVPEPATTVGGAILSGTSTIASGTASFTLFTLGIFLLVFGSGVLGIDLASARTAKDIIPLPLIGGA